MQPVNVKMYLTEQEYQNLLNGTKKLMGLLKDAATNKIDRHIPLVDQTTKEIAKQGSKLMSKSLLVGLGVLAVAAVGTVATVGIVKFKRNKKKQVNQLLISNGYNQSLISYIDKAQKGTLSFNEIKKFTDYIDAILIASGTGDITLELSSEEVSMLHTLLKRFTLQMCEANNYKLPNELRLASQKIEIADDRNKVNEIRELLYIQQDVYAQKRDTEELKQDL